MLITIGPQVTFGGNSVGVLVAFIAYIGRFYGRLDSMSRIVSHTQKAAAGAKRIFEILDHVSSVPETTHPQKLPSPLQGQIRIREAGFRYGNRAVIRGLDLERKASGNAGVLARGGGAQRCAQCQGARRTAIERHDSGDSPRGLLPVSVCPPPSGG